MHYPRIGPKPFPKGGGWRYRLTLAPGSYAWASVGTDEADALRLAEAALAEYKGQVAVSIGGLADAYLERLRIAGNKQGSLDGTKYELHRMLEPLAHLLPASLTERRAKDRYLEVAGSGVAAATHHTTLRRVKALWKWALSEGLVKMNPWANVLKIGRANRGKPQLTLDEAAKLTDACANFLHDDRAIGVLLAIMCGLRGGEIAARNVRDVDQEGSVLWIQFGKSPAAKREARIPEMLRPALMLRTANRPGEEPLLRTVEGERIYRGWLNRAVEHYCGLAGVPLVVPHAFRGQYATIMYERGVDPEIVAGALGHASSSVTKAHYAKPGSEQTGQDRQRERYLSTRPEK